MSPSRAIRVLGAVVVAGVLLAFVLRHTSAARVGGLLVHAPPGLLLAAATAALAFQVARAVRYRILLVGQRPPLAMAPVLGASMTAWALSLALPGILGDALFVWLLRRTAQVPLLRGAGAAVIARGFDLTSLALIALLVAPAVGVALPAPVMAAMFSAGLAIGGAMLAMLWATPRRAVLARLARLPRMPGTAARLEEAAAAMSGRRRLAGMVATTLAARLVSVLEYMALFAAVGMPLAFWQAAFTVSTRTLLLAFPIQGVAGLGTTQLWWTAALLLLGRRLAGALAASLAVHLLDLAVSLPVALLGLVLFARVSSGATRTVPAPKPSIEPHTVEAGGD
ncbi:MAG: lysylphosphatidylglycerol synthase domain-containing protein [Candidatus Dormibacteraceae bacterium]